MGATATTRNGNHQITWGDQNGGVRAHRIEMGDTAANGPDSGHLFGVRHRNDGEPVGIEAIALQGGTQGKGAGIQGTMRDREAQPLGAYLHHATVHRHVYIRHGTNQRDNHDAPFFWRAFKYS